VPYDVGKLSVNRGSLQVRYLNNGYVTTTATFQLPNNVPFPNAHVAPPRSARARRVFTRTQVQALAAVVQDLGEMDLDYDPTNPYLASDLITGPEFVFHGSRIPWDEIHESGGLRAVGMNTGIGAHVHNSTQAQSAYVSGTRALSVATSFAGSHLLQSRGEYGFVYLFHIEGGIQISPVHGHNQAEIAGVGQVPISDILMFKWLAQPRKIYINREYTATPLTAITITQGLIAIGGGATP
jgi:hypothetical protein